MALDYNLFNILILFGAIQGFILCFFLYKNRSINYLATNFFLLFLFSLSFFNLIYAFLDMDLFKYYRPLHMFPFPYKWLIGAGFYFYIKNQFPPSEDETAYHKKEWYILIPAFVYLLLKTYWFSISVKENSYRITSVIVESNFFRIHEFFFLFFTLFMGIASLLFLYKNENRIVLKSVTALNWLKKLTWTFILITLIDVFLFSCDLIIHSGSETFGFYYATLIINAAFIYWIGFMGFTKSKLFFNNFKHITEFSNSQTDYISKKLDQIIKEEKVYINPNITLLELSKLLSISSSELSKYFNTTLGVNFSEFINNLRVEEVKKLMASDNANKYTLVSLAEKAGFNSKSSFNATFKKITGYTPSAYRKHIQG